MLLKDRIIPEMWTSKVYRHQWQLLLRADQGVDRGPQSMTDAEFEKLCLRCGRTLNSGGQPHMWRWTGFNMGLDLIITFDDYTISLKRSLTARQKMFDSMDLKSTGVITFDEWLKFSRE